MLCLFYYVLIELFEPPPRVPSFWPYLNLAAPGGVELPRKRRRYRAKARGGFGVCSALLLGKLADTPSTPERLPAIAVGFHTQLKFGATSAAKAKRGIKTQHQTNRGRKQSAPTNLPQQEREIAANAKEQQLGWLRTAHADTGTSCPQGNGARCPTGRGWGRHHRPHVTAARVTKVPWLWVAAAWHRSPPQGTMGWGGHGVPRAAQQQEGCTQLQSPPGFVSSSPIANTSLSPRSSLRKGKHRGSVGKAPLQVALTQGRTPEQHFTHSFNPPRFFSFPTLPPVSPPKEESETLSAVCAKPSLASQVHSSSEQRPSHKHPNPLSADPAVLPSQTPAHAERS